MNACPSTAVRATPSPEWAQLVQSSLHEVLDIMLGVKVTPLQRSHMPADMTAMVGLAGSLCGLFIIRCSRATAVMLASKMLGVETVDSEVEVLDGLGEICNMVAGSFKAKIPNLGDGCMLSVPTTVTGADYEIHPLHATPAYLQLHALCGDSPVQIRLHISS